MTYNDLTIEKRKGHAAVIATRPLRRKPKSEGEFETKLQVAGIQSAGRLAKVPTRVVVMRSSALRCQNEIGAVEHIETIRVEFHVDPFRELEGLGKSHVGGPVARTDERIAAQVAAATQAWRRECGW